MERKRVLILVAICAIIIVRLAAFPLVTGDSVNSSDNSTNLNDSSLNDTNLSMNNSFNVSLDNSSSLNDTNLSADNSSSNSVNLSYNPQQNVDTSDVSYNATSSQTSGVTSKPVSSNSGSAYQVNKPITYTAIALGIIALAILGVFIYLFFRRPKL